MALWQGRWPLPGCARRVKAQGCPVLRSASPCGRDFFSSLPVVSNEGADFLRMFDTAFERASRPVRPAPRPRRPCHPDRRLNPAPPRRPEQRRLQAMSRKPRRSDTSCSTTRSSCNHPPAASRPCRSRRTGTDFNRNCSGSSHTTFRDVTHWHRDDLHPGQPLGVFA